MLQGIEFLFPFSPEAGCSDHPWRFVVLRVSIVLQLVLASVLVAATGGNGSIYELIYLLPIVSAATMLPGRDLAIGDGGAVAAMVGFIVTGNPLSASIDRVKVFQDSVAELVYFPIAGLHIQLFSHHERGHHVR